ncbi:hypothetical protein ACQKWADRAFT_278791 [Trichoderma austrokoningii]
MRLRCPGQTAAGSWSVPLASAAELELPLADGRPWFSGHCRCDCAQPSESLLLLASTVSFFPP